MDVINKLILELRDLEYKISKLDSFLRKESFQLTIKESQLKLLQLQIKLMTDYSAILRERLIDLDPNWFDLTPQFDFSHALTLLKNNNCITRLGWNGSGLFVCKQVPTTIMSEIIPKMTSLHSDAKELVMSTCKHIDYRNQMLIINTNTGTADSWVPSSSDLYAADWVIYKLKNK